MSSFRLIEGDSLVELRKLPAANVDGIVTDPPYSSGGAFRGDRTLKTSEKYVFTNTKKVRVEYHGDNRDQRSFGYWCTLWLAECWRIAKPGAVLCSFIDWRQLPVLSDSIQAGGWVWRGILPWDKTEASRPRKGYFRAQAEYILWASKGPLLNRQDGPYLAGLARAYYQGEEREHMAGKPLEVLRWLVQVTLAGGTILDPFLGGGTTALAAILEGRNCIGIEIDAGFCEMARARVQREAGLLVEVTD